jgi:phosphopantothenoylcysteine decarboxylase
VQIMAKVLLGVTGSVAAIHTPALFRALKQAGHDARVVATDAALYFFDPAELDPLDAHKPARNPAVVTLDADEWPGHYQRGDPVLHIELRRWADVLLIAPLDANTLAKLACGLCDNCLTCVARAWDRTRPIVLAPAMNTLMWEHPLTTRHLRQLADLATPAALPTTTEALDLIAWINSQCATLRVVPPVSKRLACDDVGMGALASPESILAALESLG